VRVDYHIEGLKLGKLEGTTKVRIGAVMHETDTSEQNAEGETGDIDPAERVDAEAEGGIKESESA
jgi:hypothetical protein